MVVLIFALMQYIVSAKAGLVNYIDGQANVRLREQVAASTPIQTAAQSHVELLLNPGSYLRLGENSAVVLDSTELTNIAVRLVDGAAIIEAADIDKQAPIHVTTGNLRVLIVSPGLYRFSAGTALVLDGKLRMADSSMTVKKGHKIALLGDSYVDGNGAVAFSDGLDRWSEKRSSDLARANAMAYRERSGSGFSSLGGYPGLGLLSNGSTWLYSSLLGGFTFIPRPSYRSYYGYSFVPLSGFRRPATFGHSASASRSPGGSTSTRGSTGGRPAGSAPLGGRVAGRSIGGSRR